jgi:hypothetical protein
MQAVAVYAGLYIAQVVADDRLRFHGRRWQDGRPGMKQARILVGLGNEEQGSE